MRIIKRYPSLVFVLVVSPLLPWFVFGVPRITSSSLFLQIQERLVPKPGFSVNVLWLFGIWMTVSLYPCVLYLTVLGRYFGSSWKESFGAMGPFLVLCPLVGFFGLALVITGGVIKIVTCVFGLAMLVIYPCRWLWRNFHKS